VAVNAPVGIGLTVTLTLADLEQPNEVPVTDYMLVEIGVAVTLVPVVPFKPADGDQV
jgi:hypothetical protein